MEEWRYIPSTDNRYMVSNQGRVKSLDMITNNGTQLRKGRIRALSHDRDGYPQLSVVINGKLKCLKVHRLVAEAFIDNPQKLPMVNHKDENPQNNQVENLEWCDCKYNSNYGTRNQRISRRLKGKCGVGKKAVLQIDIYTDAIVATYSSIDEAVRICGFSTRSHISECCAEKPKRNSAHGYKWRYAIPDLIKVTK